MQDQIETKPVLDETQLLVMMLVRELDLEITVNKDSSGFWRQAIDCVFSQSLISFREGVTLLKDEMKENKEMMNYFSALCFRVFSQQFSKEAIKAFITNFDELSKDDVFMGTFKYSTKDLTQVEKLLLFFSVHRNEITFIIEQERTARTQNNQRPRQRNK